MFTAREIHLTTVDPNIQWKTLRFSPDGKRVAYVMQEHRAGTGVVMPWETGEPDFMGMLERKLRGQDIAAVVVDGEQQTNYDEVGTPVFSPDSRRVAYTARKGDHWCVVVDGKEGESYEEIHRLCFSPDGRHVSFIGRSEDGWVATLDEAGHDTFDDADLNVFSPNSQRWAFAAKREDSWQIIVDAKPGKSFEIAGEVVFSPDSQHLAYCAGASGENLVVIDGVEGKSYEGIYASGLQYSPDNQRVAFAAKSDDQSLFIVGDQELGPYDGITLGVFSPDGRQFAFGAQEGSKWRVMTDGKPGKHYVGIGQGTLRFSPDSQRLAYQVDCGRNKKMVIDGVEGPACKEIGGPPVFSPDSQRVAYGAMHKGKWHIVTAEGPGPSYAAIVGGTLCFSPDSKHLAYATWDGKEHFIVLDGTASSHFDGVGELAFTSAKQLRAIGIRGADIFRIEIDL